LKLVPDTVPEGFSDPLRQWPLYMLLIVGPAGFLLNQDAFQAGILISPVLAVITTADPLVFLGIAHFWLKEEVASMPPDLAVEAISLAVMAGGIVALAHRAAGGDAGKRMRLPRLLIIPGASHPDRAMTAHPAGA
jgi:hypothetical protein